MKLIARAGGGRDLSPDLLGEVEVGQLEKDKRKQRRGAEGMTDPSP